MVESTMLRKIRYTKRLRIDLDQTLQSRSQALQSQRRKTDQKYPKVPQPRLPRCHRLRKSTSISTQGCVIHSRSSANQYFNFHYMFGGFKKWVVDRYIVGSLYRNGFRVMWFPALLYYVCNNTSMQSVAIT